MPILDETYKVTLNRPFFLKGVARFRAYGGGLDDTQAEDWEEASKLTPPPQGAGGVTLVWLHAQRDVNTYAWIELATTHHYALPRGIQILGLRDDDTLSIIPFGHGARRVGGRVWDG